MQNGTTGKMRAPRVLSNTLCQNGTYCDADDDFPPSFYNGPDGNSCRAARILPATCDERGEVMQSSGVKKERMWCLSSPPAGGTKSYDLGDEQTGGGTVDSEKLQPNVTSVGTEGGRGRSTR